MKSQQKSRRGSSTGRTGRRYAELQQDRSGSNGSATSRADMSGKTDNNWFVLNVGGTYFMTSKPTLTRLTSMESPLYRLTINSTRVQFDRDEHGAHLIDRDPAHFNVVLNYLRHGHLVLTRDTTEEGVLLEAEFFNLPGLQRLVQQRMERSHSSSNCLPYQTGNNHQQAPINVGPVGCGLSNNDSINNQLASTGSVLSGTISTFNNFGLGMSRMSPIGNSLSGLLGVEI